jgi:hypothetical protein
MFFMMPLIVLWVLWQFRGQTHKVVRALAIPLVALLLLVPWTVRNYLAFGRFIPISSQGGVTFLECNNRIVATNPMWYGYAVYARYHMPEFAELITRTHDESEISQVASHWAAQWLWDNPDKWCLLLYHKFCRAWTPFLQPHVAWPLRVGSVLTWGPILVLFPPAAFTTLWLFLRRGHPGWLLHLGILHYVLNVIPFLGFSRYRYPIEGLCIILACVSVVWLYERYALLCQTCANHKRAPLAGVRMRFAT